MSKGNDDLWLLAVVQDALKIRGGPCARDRKKDDSKKES
jgi:hypothetical protein